VSEILVAGTGRSGTLSWAKTLQTAGLDIPHEPSKPMLTLALPYWLCGGISDSRFDQILRDTTFGNDGASFHLFSAMVAPLQRRFPDARWLWPTRNAPDTVASMVACGWYDPAADNEFPAGPLWVWFADDKVQGWARPLWSLRPSAYLVGEMTWPEWRTLPQPGRCAWWWDYVWRQLRGVGLVYPVESHDPNRVLRWLGLPEQQKEWVANYSPEPPEVSGEVRGWVARFCSDGMDDLYG
jgi:hypothetical protein